jgi:selenocysteine lyase/cysteine desulfurase
MRIDRPIAYFNHAGLSRPQRLVTTRMRAAEAEYRAQLFSEAGIEMYYATLRECRSAVADLLGVAGPGGISLVANATTALQILLSALGASLAPGATVLTSDQEHPSVVRPLNMLAARGVEIITIAAASAAEMLARVEEQMRAQRPALVILSHVSYKNGRILPVVEIGALLARDAIPYIVDGAQALGHITVDVPAMRAWAYVFSGHKWIGGPWGTGGLWTSEQLAGHNRFTLSNWAYERDPPDGGRYEGGTMNYALIAGLAEVCRQAGAALSRRMRGLSRTRTAIRKRLEGIFPDADATWQDGHAPGIVAYLMQPALDSWTLAARMLRNHGVAIKPFRPPERPDAIRISYAPSTPIVEVERLAMALRTEASATRH